jgi:hypothetical protein
MMKYFNLMLLLVMFSLCACGQEVGVTGLKLWSDNDQLENPFGFGIYAASSVAKKMNARLEYNYVAKTRLFTGQIPETVNPDPKADPETEAIEGRARLHAVDLSFLFEMIQTSMVNIDLGFVLGLNILGGKREGLSTGLSADWSGATKFGIGLAGMLKTPEIQNLPLSFNVVFKQKLLRSSTASADEEDPFSDSLNISQLQIGIAYKF